MKHVIIGAGIAGVSAADSIRKLDKDAEIVLIGEERYFPYKRYLLTEFLLGSIDSETIFYTSASYFEERKIKLRKGERIKAISPEEKTIKFFHNEIMNYDRLLIATGACPELGPVLRPFRDHIQRYYSLRDILLIKRRLTRLKNAVVFGTGLSTLDVICCLVNLGVQVRYIVKGTRAHLPLIESEFDMDLHEFLCSKGVEILTNDRVVAVRKENDKLQVKTLSQKDLLADIVFAWDYYQPNLAVISGTKIEKKIGILVDQQMRTSVNDIFAAGDCVEIYHPQIKDYWINFGWPNAAEQGEIAGKNMAGAHVEYPIHETIPFNLMGKALKARWWE